jgi:two-component system sensor histidine kinase KdpD
VRAGVIASGLSFLALNFFFTPPFHTFVVGKFDDLLALVVFLLVSVITGVLLSTALTQKATAERRELQTRLSNKVNGRLLTGQPVDEVLADLAEGLSRLLRLTRIEITTVTTEPVSAGLEPASTGAGPLEIDLRSTSGTVGKIRLLLDEGRGPLDPDERMVLEGIAGQLALALESLRLSDEVKSVQLEAETSRLRAALFSGITHDLKTPLAAITASVTSLLDGSGFSEHQRREHLETISQEADHLDRVVSNLLELGRLRAGALTPSKEPGAIDELIEAVVGRMQHLLKGRDVALTVRGHLPEIPMDLVQIEQVLTNLIENAIKFSPTGSPIRVSVVGGPHGVRVTVVDAGPGVAEEDRERIFEPFETGDLEMTGTGLGLAIAGAVVVAHGGRIWADEAVGGGAAITFELPAGSEPEVESLGHVPSLSG